MLHSVFRYGLGGSLEAEGTAIETALAEAGAPTPAYVYSGAAVAERYARIEKALFGCDHLIALPLKANALPALVTPLVRRGAGVEAVSAAELLVAAGIGVPEERIVMSGVGKTKADLDTALDLGVRFLSIESEAELALLDARAASRGLRARVALRLNPAISAPTHPKIATGSATAKFGISEAELLSLAKRRREWPAVEILGVHAHIGSQILDLSTLTASARRLGAVFAKLRRAGTPVRLVDVGGGLGIPQRLGEAEISLAVYAEAVRDALRETAGGMEPAVVFEPGRALFGPAGVLVVRVLHTKRTGGREFCVVDGGMNDFLRPAMYGAYHRIVPLRVRGTEERAFDVVGGVCETGDAFARNRMLTPPEPGDLLGVLDAGAYGFSMSSNYNLRPRPAEVVLRDGAAVLARQPETPPEVAARELAAASVLVPQ